jgi:beta-glucosidase
MVSFTLTPRQLSVIDNQSRRIVERGEVEIAVGGGQPVTVGPGPIGRGQVRAARLTLTGDVFHVK